MTKNQKKLRVVRAEPEEMIEETLVLEDDALQAKIAEFQEAFGGQEYKYSVDKWMDDVKRWAGADRYPLDNFDPFLVREQFGGGRYRARLFDGSGKYVKGGGYVEFYLAPVPKKDKEPERKEAGAESMILTILLEQNKALLNQQTEMIRAMSAPKTEAATPMKELVETLARLKTLEPRDRESGFDNISKMAGVFKTLQDLFDRGGRGDGGSSWLGDLKEAAGLLKPILQEMSARRGAPAAPAPAIAHVEGAPMIQANKWTPVMEVLASHLPKFEEAAKRKEPVREWAEFLLEILEKQVLPLMVPIVREERSVPKFVKDDVVEDGIVDYLMEQAKEPDTIARVCDFWPTLSSHAAWVQEVVTEAGRVLEKESKGEEPAPAEG